MPDLKEIGERAGEIILIQELFEILIEKRIVERADVIARLKRLSIIHTSPNYAIASNLIDGVCEAIAAIRAE